VALCLAGVVVALATSPKAADPDPDAWEALVVEGRQLWTRSPDPQTPVACATCHHDPETPAGWAASFPRFRPLPPPHARVMTLVQATAEAVERHYPGLAVRPAATAIGAYLTALAGGRPVTPGLAPGETAFAGRLAALREAARRGRERFGARCAGCHAAAAVAPAAVSWWRIVRATGQSVETYLEGHLPGAPPLRWDSAATAEVLAYLAGSRAGRILEVQNPETAQEATR
jgi:mono/diheme cytochrome c family protein